MDRKTGYFLLSILVIAVILLYLWLEDPQKGIMFFRFQSRIGYWLGKYENPIVPVPRGYSGRWFIWYPNGRRIEGHYKDGVRNGKTARWDKNGNIETIVFYSTKNCLSQRWEDKKQVSKCIYMGYKKWYGYYLNANTDEIDYYLDYKQVSREEYEKWEASGGSLEALLKKHPEIER